MPKKIKILSESRHLLANMQNVQNEEAAKIMEQSIREAAAVDGDRVLDQFEAEALHDAYKSVLPDGGPITPQAAGKISSALSLQIGQLSSKRIESTEVMFTSEGRALDRFRNKILGSMQETIDKANGRPVDINMMVFSFTDKELANGILEMAKEHPNANFRLMTDWTQLSSSGSKQASRLIKEAEAQGLDNIHVKFKKDNPYVWSERKNRPTFSHRETKGLNHHKGFVTLIDGRPEKMTFGSFNWSVSAMKRNYENMMLLDRADADNRPIMDGYQKEFEAFWNNDDAALTRNEALQEKNRIFKEMHEARGLDYTPLSAPSTTDEVDPEYRAEDKSEYLDINSFADQDNQRLQDITGKRLAGKIQKELRDYGRFDTWTELLARVPDVASAPTWTREKLMENLEYGEGGLSINTATATELDRAGLSKRQSERVVAFREKHGAFENLNELDDVRGIGQGTIRRIAETMTDDQNEGFYSARVPGNSATTGFATENQGDFTLPVSGTTEAHVPDAEGVVAPNRAEQVTRNRALDAPVADMLRRAQPGQTFRLAMYGLSTSSPEFGELKTALKRGVKVRVVLYNKYNDRALDAIEQLKDEGYDIDCRHIKSRVMHEKFGVVGDDVFNGSSNWSGSSIKKHAEDRFLFRNSPDLSNRFIEEFNRLWERGNPIAAE